jgi:hypothetical protein
MRTFLMMAGAAWLLLAVVLTFSVARAARRRMPWPSLPSSAVRPLPTLRSGDATEVSVEAEREKTGSV